MATTLNNRALSLLDLERKDKAMALFDRALEIEAHHPEATYNRGLLLWRDAKITDLDLVNELEEVRRSHDETWMDEYYLSLINMERGDWERAKNVLSSLPPVCRDRKEVKEAVDRCNNGVKRCHHSCCDIEIPDLKGGVHEGFQVIFSLDGRFLIHGNKKGEIELYSTSSGRKEKIIKGHESPLTCLRIRQGDKLISSAKDDSEKVWDLNSMECLSTSQKSHEGIRSEDPKPPETRFIVKWDRSGFSILRAETGEEIISKAFEYQMFRRCIWEIDSSGKYLSTLHCEYAAIWEMETGRCIRTFRIRNHEPDTADMMSYYRSELELALNISVIGQEFDLKVLTRKEENVATLKKFRFFCSTAPHFHGRVQKSEQIEILQEHHKRMIQKLKAALNVGSYPLAYEYMLKARKISGFNQDRAIVESCKKIHQNSEHKQLKGGWEVFGHRSSDRQYRRVINAFYPTQPFRVRLSPDGRFCGLGKKLSIWDIEEKKCVHERLTTEDVHDMYLTKNSEFAIVFKKDSNEIISVFNGKRKKMNFCKITVSPDEKWCLCGHSLLNFRKGSSIQNYFSESALSTYRAFTPDGTLMMSVTNRSRFGLGHLGIWDFSNRKELLFLDLRKKIVISPIACCPTLDSRMVYLYDGSKICLYDYLYTRNSMKEVEACPLNCLRFSPNGRLFAGGDKEGNILVWDLKRMEFALTLNAHSHGISDIDISPDHRFIVSVSTDGVFKIWHLDWDLEPKTPADWNEDALPYLKNFLTLQTPYAGELPHDREPTEEEITSALTRQGKPQWTEEDFKRLLFTLSCAGLGWVRPEGVRAKLEQMASTWTGPPDLFASN